MGYYWYDRMHLHDWTHTKHPDYFLPQDFDVVIAFSLLLVMPLWYMLLRPYKEEEGEEEEDESVSLVSDDTNEPE